jgi:hypothetical protein
MFPHKGYTSWRYFLVNYERGFVPFAGSHSLLILSHMHNFYLVNNYIYGSTWYNLKSANYITNNVLNNKGSILTSKNEKQILTNTTLSLYKDSPLLFKYAVKLNERYINFKRYLGFEFNEYKGDKTLLDIIFEKIFN